MFVVMVQIAFFSFFLTTSILFSQEIPALIDRAQSGNAESVREQLQRLKSQQPDNPGVIYLEALITDDADEAMILYKKILQNFPESDYADESAIKIGSYLFARGLYSQSSNELRLFAKKYSDSPHLQRAVDLHINSLHATGEKDSAKSYIKRYSEKFPDLDTDYTLESGEPLYTRSTESLQPLEPAESVTIRKLTPKSTPKEPVLPRPYVVQVGAFSSVANAMRQKSILEELGYEVNIIPVKSRGKTLQAVQIVRFSTKSEAEKIGSKLKKEFGFNYMVTKRGE
mgnify:FL=1